MVWEQRVQVITMLTSPVEGGKVKCEVYWPQVPGKEMATRDGPFVIRCVGVSQHSAHVTLTTLQVLKTDTNETLDVTHVHYTGWPDHGVPDNTDDFVGVVQYLESLRRHNGNTPSLVHCSAGVGRTGVLVVVTVALDKVCL